MIETPSSQAGPMRNCRRDRSVCTDQFKNGIVDAQPISYALPNWPEPVTGRNFIKTCLHTKLISDIWGKGKNN